MAAYIDLKNCHFYIEDGYSKTGTVGTGGATLGTTTVPVAGFTEKIDSGVAVKLGTLPETYTIVSTTETSNATTSIVVTPALSGALTAADAVVVGPHVLEVKIGEGNLTYDEKKAREYKKDRGKLDQVRNGDEDPIDVNFQFAWLYLSSATGATTPTVEEALEQTGPAATWVSTGTDCEPYAVNLVVVNDVPTCGTETNPVERVKLPQFRHESLAHDPKAGTVTAQGKCNATKAIKTRLAVSTNS